MDESDMAVSITCKSFKLQCDLYPLHLISFHCLIEFHVHCAYYITASGPVPQPELFWNGLEERCMCMGPEGDWKDMFCWEKLWYICEANYKGPFPYDP